MSAAGTGDDDQDDGAPEGTSLEAMVDVVGFLRAELQSIRDREQRREGKVAPFDDASPSLPSPPPDPTEPAPLATLDDRALRDQLTRLEHSLAEGLAWMPPTLPEGLAERSDLDRLGAQIDALRAAVDAQPEPAPALPQDLQPVIQRIDQLQQQIARLATTAGENVVVAPAPVEPVDLQPLLDGIDQLHEQVAALALAARDRPAAPAAAEPIDLEPLHERLDHLGRQLAAAPAPDLQPLREQLDALQHQIAASPVSDLSPIHAHLERLNQQVASLPRSDEVVSALAPQLDALRAATAPNEVLDAIDSASATLRDQIATTTDVGPAVRRSLEPVTAHMDRLAESSSSLRVDLALATEVLVGLTQLSEASEQHLAELAEAQRAAPATDQRAVLTEAVGDLSQELGQPVRRVEAQLEALTSRLTTLESSVGTNLIGATSRLEEAVGARIEDQLRGLGVGQLRSAIAELVQQVVDARAEDRDLLENVLQVDERLTDLQHLARTGAPTSAEGPGERPDPVTPEDLETVEASLYGAIRMLGERLANQAKDTTESIARLIPPPAPPRTGPDPILVALQASVERLSEELATTRAAVERRPAGRWRRRGPEDDAPTEASEPEGPSPHEEHVDAALAAMDDRLTGLTQLVERATAHSIEAASSARAALVGVSAAARAAAPRVAQAPVKAATTTKKAATTTKKSAATTKKSAATKKVVAKKSAPAWRGPTA